MNERLKKAIERLQEDLDMTADWNKMVTVKRDDLQFLLESVKTILGEGSDE